MTQVQIEERRDIGALIRYGPVRVAIDRMVPASGLGAAALGAGLVLTAVPAWLTHRRLDRHLMVDQDLVRHRLDRADLVRQLLDRAHLERRRVDRRRLDRPHLVRPHLVRPHLVGTHLERRLLVRHHLGLAVSTNPRHRQTSAVR